MHGYYAQANTIPQYIIMLEEAQKKAKGGGMPIANVKLVMMALVAVLAAMHFPRKVDNWEGSSHSDAHGRRGKHLSTPPTSSANVRFWPWGVGSHLGACTVFFPRIHR